VYQWGQVSRTRTLVAPERIATFEQHPVDQISVTCPGYFHGRQYSEYHAAALTKEGSFWMWGGNHHGQLFLKDGPCVSEASKGVPQEVDYFRQRGEQVLRFSCGVQITVVQTKDKAGCTRVHETGSYRFRGMYETLSQQREVSELQDLAITQLVCGGFFACAVDGEGRLWTWGSSRGPDMANGSLLGRGIENHRRGGRVAPGVVDTLLLPVKRISCSTYTTLVVLEDGSVFTWGDCDGSSLGHQETRCHVPHPLDLEVADLSVDQASLAYTNGAVATRDGRIFMWGGGAWDHGISRKTASDEGLPSELMWRGVALGYRCKNLILGHSHAYIIACKVAK